MYKVLVDDTPVIDVQTRSKRLRLAVDASAMNPLEAFYATLAGCAAVYAKKACAQLGLSAAGLQIQCRPGAGKAGALSLERFETRLSFPESFPAAARAEVLAAVRECAVKQVVQQGAAVQFSCVEVPAEPVDPALAAA
ncbi:OsmC family protein [Ideonella livida]|uniref:OsmC family peroxiredoxin n=1 Tax=Ideonella livida TaxID=2707176 RepID=A0A7C9TNV8_9BURK|nr:OsmC family protein [Ideonella livida]NDY94005.1 hypothetical protein [Ideonella livida]